MIKYYCDICEKEITNKRELSRMEGEFERISYAVIIAIDGIWNGGHACHDCIRKAIAACEQEKDNGSK